MKIRIMKEKATPSKLNWNQERVDKWFAAHRRRSERSPIKEWLAARRQAGLKLDPKNAEFSFSWCYGYTVDPYGIGPKLPWELQVTQRLWFVRAKGSDIWVEDGDLPKSTSKALQRISEKKMQKARR